MAMKSIIVFLDSTAASEARVGYAARLAKQHEAHLVGVFIVPNAWEHDRSDGFIRGGGAIHEMLERQNAAERTSLEDAGRKFETLARHLTPSFEYRTIRGSDVSDRVRGHCLHADLVVVGFPSPGGLPKDCPPERMLLASGVPTLIVPSDWGAGSIASKVLFGWNASREARRAITDGLPLLRAAQSVSVLIVDAGKTPHHSHEPGADIAQYLARHRVAVQVEVLHSKGLPIADVIRRYAAESGSDLILLGAYSHSPRREQLFGGVTRSLLSSVTVPTLIAH
jgi:nucleotide-binding universal stress UspA family protein